MIDLPDSPSDRLGAVRRDGTGFHFRVWAPRARRLAVEWPGSDRAPTTLERGPAGYFVGSEPGASPGERYWLRLDRRRFPDPASRSQPDGVAGPSQLVDLTASVPGLRPGRPIDLARTVLYELHIGTFSAMGTFAGALPLLSRLARTGITAVELLPVGEERGARGWGYGPVLPFAVRHAYGGADGLRSFVAAAHESGLSVLLDVVYNHWSGQATFLERFGPYFHRHASTPWGPTPNVDGAGADEVRRYFFENARMWLEEFGVDGFRLDAVHEIHDRSARPFWAEFSEYCAAVSARTGTPAVLIAESDLNDVKVLRPPRDGGWGLTAQWSDDFHNALHAALTGERQGYYADFGSLEQLAEAFEHPFLFEGQLSKHRDRRHGAPARGLDPARFVVFDQNHDQIGNRGDGARLTTLLSPGMARVALGLTVLSPYVPMLFMGEEYAETRPFFFFAEAPPAVAHRLARSRLEGIRGLGFSSTPPDPSDPSTMEQSRLDWAASERPAGLAARAYLSDLLRLRREVPAFAPGGTLRARAWSPERRMAIRREAGTAVAQVLFNLAPGPQAFAEMAEPGLWTLRLDSSYGARTTASIRGRSVRPPPDRDPWTSIPGESLVVLERS